MTDLQNSWWLVGLRGLVAMIFGVIALARPMGTATALVILVALFVLVDGVFSLATAVRRHSPSWGFGVFQGILGLVIGILGLVLPEATAMVVAVLIGIWALVTGVLELVMAVRLRHEMQWEWLLGTAGVLSILLGIAVVIAPAGGVVAIAVLVGIYALLFGVSRILYAFRLRRLSRS